MTDQTEAEQAKAAKLARLDPVERTVLCNMVDGLGRRTRPADKAALLLEIDLLKRRPCAEDIEKTTLMQLQSLEVAFHDCVAQGNSDPAAYRNAFTALRLYRETLKFLGCALPKEKSE